MPLPLVLPVALRLFRRRRLQLPRERIHLARSRGAGGARGSRHHGVRNCFPAMNAARSAGSRSIMESSLRQVLLAGEGVGELTGPGTGQGVADHPVCGDRVQLSVQHEDGTIRAVRWRAAGCPASMAVAALCAKVLVDVPVASAAAALRAAVAAHGGLASHERHAEVMALRALAVAVQS